MRPLAMHASPESQYTLWTQFSCAYPASGAKTVVTNSRPTYMSKILFGHRLMALSRIGALSVSQEFQ